MRAEASDRGPRELCNSTDLCRDILTTVRSLGKSCLTTTSEQCIGYLDAADSLRHLLLTPHSREKMAIGTIPGASVPFSSILKNLVESVLPVPQQLRLALCLARSVLQLHSTPWWRQSWSISDLAFFSIDNDLSASLRTLHISKEIHPATPRVAPQMQDVVATVPAQPAEADDDSRIVCGIRNVTIHSLGVALLQIGRWKLLDEDDILQVRKAAERPSRLGPKYDDLTRKCLYCDFGQGDDLHDPLLRSAVYDRVVRRLQSAIFLLEG